MEPIKRFDITELTVSGFKCYDKPLTAEFGEQTVITGGNGRGKSSVADAIAFAVTGKPFFGEAGIDRLYTDGSKDLIVSMRLTDENDAEHLLTRSRRADRVTITYDGRELRQSDLNVLFGEKDVFLSIFNPLYFIEELGDDGRRLLERHLPAVPHESVLALLNKPTQELIGSEEILSPDTYLKRRREELRELEDSVIYLTGQKDHAETKRLEAKQRAAALSDEIAGIEGEIRALEEKRFADGGAEDVQERLTELSARYEELAKEAPETPETAQIDGELNTLHRKLGERSAEQYTPKYAAPIEETTIKVKNVAARYKRELAALNGFKAGTVCPTCRRTVTEAELPAVKAELQKSVDALFAEGRSIKAQLDELSGLEAKTEATFHQFQTDDVTAMQGRIAELEQQRSGRIAAASARNERRRNELDAMLAEIRSLSAEADCGALSPEELERLNERKKALEGRQAEYAALLLTANAAPENFDAKIDEAEGKIAKQKKRIAAAAQYVAKRTELLFSSLKMNRVEISLYDVVKTTGEVRDTFRFTYNGRRYDRLSLSEKIRAGMEVSELVKRLTGRNYPQFIDNMESVDDLANVNPTGQVIMAKCVHGAPLCIRPVGQARAMPKAA